MQVYETSGLNRNIVTEVWSPTAPTLNQTYDIVAHDAAEDATAGRIHILKLEVSSGLKYYVEVRQKPTGLIFDQNIAVSNADDGIVLVTRVLEGTSIANTMERPIMVFGAIDVGEQVVDAARGLTIRVDQIVQHRPLVYRVRVTWNQPIAGDPDGQFDFAITPWTTDNWETVDIWVDSPRNNSGSTIVYENHEDGDTGKPVLNGDRPWVGRVNQIHARIRNTGPMSVNDVYVTFYVNSPPGIGDNGDWATLETKHIPVLDGRDPAIPGSGEMILGCDWKPKVGEHTCIKVAIKARDGEVSADNNFAQENVFSFDSAGASSHEPVRLKTMVRSPFSIWRKVDALVRGLPPGWHAVVNHAWVWTAPKGSHELEVVMWTDLNAPYDFTPAYIRHKHKGEQEIPPRALIKVDGWTTFDHRYLPIGGILADAKATRKVDIEWSVDTGSEQIFLSGCLRPGLAGVPVTVEITDARGKPRHLHAVTDQRGCFDLSKDENTRLPTGEFTVQVFTTAGSEAAEIESEPRKVVVR